eukprot:TRINITY_DN15205_c0_g1_i1.p1 TRINITY_DN15205_c0_g1~~TRINITY_DN15205_c0_g1_i1.p1  ORF type:complete len:189 (+),score=16.10 TRINITY_DN15205_c0_g1_i1:34-567(+)
MQKITIALVCLIAANVCLQTYDEKIQICDGCTSITVGDYHEESCSTLLDTVDSSSCFSIAGRKGLTDFNSYNFVAENGSYVWYTYSDGICTPAKALLMGNLCAKDTCCSNGGFYAQNNTQLFNAIRVGLPQTTDDDDDGLTALQIALIVVGSVTLAVAIVAVVVFIVKRRRTSYQSV